MERLTSRGDCGQWVPSTVSLSGISVISVHLVTVKSCLRVKRATVGVVVIPEMARGGQHSGRFAAREGKVGWS